MKYSVLVPGVGPTPCDLMIVGEAPGREEIKKGIPFCGRSGELLNDALKKAGITREGIYITNRFKGDVGEGNPTPTKEQLIDHSDLFLDEIDEIVQPKFILTLGKTATICFLSGGNEENRLMKDLVGKPFYEPWSKARIYPCYHPAYILRNRKVDVVNKFYSVVYNFINSI